MGSYIVTETEDVWSTEPNEPIIDNSREPMEP
jgi:hypothetical protein